MLDVDRRIRRTRIPHSAFAPFREDVKRLIPFAERLERAADADAAVRHGVLSSFVAVSATLLEDHFVWTERLLLPVTRRVETRRKALAEHRMLRSMSEEAARRLRREWIDPTWLGNLGRRLREHLRWTEREWMPEIQGSVSPERLSALCESTAVYGRRNVLSH